MLSKRVTSLLITLLLLVGVVIIPAGAANEAAVQLDSYYLTVGVDQVSVIRAMISDGSDCKINFISTSNLVTIGETVFNEATHISSATVTGKAVGQDMILAVAEGNYSNGVFIVTVPEYVADGNVVNHTLKVGTASSNDNSSPTAETPNKGIGQVSSAYTDNGNVRTWNIVTKVGSAGNRTINVKASSYETMLDTAIPVNVTVKK